MKRISLLAMAVALVMTLAQCKKTETPTNENEGGKVHITLDVNDDAKVIITPETGGTAFEQGDKVLVANAGHYVGTLTYNKSLRKFDGDLDEGLNENDYLHFYLLGNKDTEEDLENSNARPTTLTVNISDQTAAYPEIAYAPSTVKYSSGVTAYNARLLNKCALVKFTTNSIRTTVAVTITGMNNKVVVNLSDNSFEYSKVNDGAISLHAESETERWGILFPQSEVNDVTSSADGFAMTEAFTVPEIIENGYLDEGIAVNLVATNPVGSINGKYTINANGDQVYFSQGNLQYIGSAATPYWKFADNQWDVLGTTTGQNSTSQTVDRDLFGWGTSGWNNGNTYYHPWDTDNRNGSSYGPPGDYDLTGEYANADWGVYNSISNGGGQAGQWRTLKKDEWVYVFQDRSGASSKYGHGKVNGQNGMILLPDEWTLPSGLSFTPGNSSWANDYTTEQWEQMEQNGAVFLPAAGYRTETSVGGVGSLGFYRSASYSNGNCAYCVEFGASSLNLSYEYNSRRSGQSVRLVRSAQ